MTQNGSEQRKPGSEPEESPENPPRRLDAHLVDPGAPPREGERPRAAVLSALRHAIGRIEGTTLPRSDHAGQDEKPKTDARFPLGAPLFDEALGGGLPRAGLLEARTLAMRDGGAGVALALALGLRLGASAQRPLLLIAAADALAEGGMPYREGLAHFGFDPAALIVVRARRAVDAAWAGEEAARSGAPALTVVEVRGNPGVLELEGTRRLHTRARETGGPVLLLRQGGEAEASAAPVRLLVEPLRSAPVPGLEALPLIGRPRFSIGLEKARGLSPRTLHLEWDPHDRRFLDHDPRAAHDSRVPGGPAAAAAQRPDPARGTGALVALRPLRPDPGDASVPSRRTGSL